MTASWLCAYMVFLLCMYTGRGRERKRDLPLLIMPPILWDKDSTLVTSFNLNYLLNALSSNKVTFGFTIGIWRVAAKSLQSCPTDSVRPHRWQPTRLPHPWDSPGKNTGVGCHFLFQCMKVKSESEVAQSCPTLRDPDPMDCNLPGSSVHGIFQARVLE